MRLRGVRVNNLKSINLDIPRGQLLCITGVSGSGKSSLAFDTLYAEGQRRYVESLSAYARQFLGRMAKPECDSISGLPPAIAIEQRVISRNPRSTVATSTEIYEYLRLLYARVGQMISPISGQEVKKHRTSDVIELASSLPERSRLYLAAPIALPEGRSLGQHLEVQLQQGYSRLWHRGGVVQIEDFDPSAETDEQPMLLIDRLALSSDPEQMIRLGESVETAFFEGRGRCVLFVQRPEGELSEYSFSNIFEADGRVFQEPTPEMFSFNNPIGACPECEGFGRVMGIEEELVIPNPNLSVFEGCVAAWRGAVSSAWQQAFILHSQPLGFPIHRPYRELTPEQKEMLWRGVPWENDLYRLIGIDTYFAMLQRDIHKVQNRVRLSHFKGKTTCPSCHGGRLKADALCVQVGGRSIAEVVRMTLDEAKAFFDSLEFDEARAHIARRLLTEIRSRLSFLQEVGLGYLTLDRLSNTLSGGESQRVTLATQLGSSLVGSLYVLDEPSIGLHQRDTSRLIGVVKRLRDLGNTVVVVEHDEEMMRSADFIVDIGPDAGQYGGEVIYSGPVGEIGLETPGHTAAFLSGRERIPLPQRRRPWREYIEVIEASRHNLDRLSLRLPLEALVVVSGVSGSGKSTLIRDIVYEGVQRLLSGEGGEPQHCTAIRGSLARIDHIEYVDQNNIGRSSRSNPATYIGAFDEIRKLYSDQPLAKQMGYKPYYFSFNKEGGRCERCKGDGFTLVEMQFMADITLVCDECGGMRFRRDLLEVEYRGVNIHQLLEMSVDEAIEFFGAQTDEKNKTCQMIVQKLRPLQTVGLGYIKIGQSSSTLSGGENQRVKLAYYLGKGSRERTLFIFDEPTTGLHPRDIRTLLSAFNALVDAGHSVIIVEHNLDVIKSADWVIDLGPEGGGGGGQLVAEGTPEEVAQVEASWTGRYLRHALDF
ncbi:excinuclease ABC subunit A [Porphyromonas sp. COT-239 OH1446]|nr:excinuclease ABC subunit A [Porphyromonas sp. COT-239 OH1446]